MMRYKVKALTTICVLTAVANVHANITTVPLQIGDNFIDFDLSEDQFDFEYISASPYENQIDYVDLIVTNHIDSTSGSTTVSYTIWDGLNPGPTLVDGAVGGDGTYRILEDPVFQSTTQIRTGHGGFTNGATSSVRFNVHVVPEPSSLALLSLGGLTLMRRRRKI